MYNLLIKDFARAVLPKTAKHKVLALLVAYFDESGTHNQYGLSPITCIAGFVGTAEEWDIVTSQWNVIMENEMFHYKDFKHKPEIIIKLAELLSSSNLQVVSAAFKGDWDKVICNNADWKIRFPSCYSALFEMTIEQMARFPLPLWKDEPIALIFSEQNQYAKRVEEVWRTMRGNGLWQRFVSFTYGSPKDLPQLQIADMLSHEIFQSMKIGTDEIWQEWPLVKRLLNNGINGIAGYHTVESFIALMEHSERNGREYLKSILKV